jgi:hypothetical protein
MLTKIAERRNILLAEIASLVNLNINVVYLKCVLLEFLFAGKLKIATTEVARPVVILDNMAVVVGETSLNGSAKMTSFVNPDVDLMNHQDMLF